MKAGRTHFKRRFMKVKDAELRAKIDAILAKKVKQSAAQIDRQETLKTIAEMLQIWLEKSERFTLKDISSYIKENAHFLTDKDVQELRDFYDGLLNNKEVIRGDSR